MDTVKTRHQLSKNHPTVPYLRQMHSHSKTPLCSCTCSTTATTVGCCQLPACSSDGPRTPPRFTETELGLAALMHLTHAVFSRLQAGAHGAGDLSQLLDLQRQCVVAYADRHRIPQARLDSALASVAGDAFTEDRSWVRPS
jgi:hypothetical protein